jgi:hypothetical protein
MCAVSLTCLSAFRFDGSKAARAVIQRIRETQYFEPREDATAEDGSPERLIAEGESHQEEKQPWRYAKQAEVMHMAYIASEEWEKFWRGHLGHALKRPLTNTIFFHRLALHVPENGEARVQLCMLASMPPSIAI